MAEFILMVVLLQPSSSLPETRWLVVAAYSVAGLSENGCKNAQRIVSSMGEMSQFGVLSVCLPKHVAKLTPEPKEPK